MHTIDCIGINGNSEVSLNLVHTTDSAVVGVSGS
jgi:hypothetical protein